MQITKKHNIKCRFNNKDVTISYMEPSILLNSQGQFIYCAVFKKPDYYSSQWLSFCYYNFKFNEFTNTSYTAKIFEKYALTKDNILILRK